MSRRNKFIAGMIAGFVLGTGCGISVAGLALAAQQPHCPTKDSCGYAWDNGPKIVEVTP